MAQIVIPDGLFREQKTTLDTHPLYEPLGLHSRISSAIEALKDFVKCNGDFMRKLIRQEIDRILL